MTARGIHLAIAAMLAVGCVAIAFGVSRVRAAELESAPPSARSHQLTVCPPDKPCERRGRPMGATACSLDAASERLLAGLPKATRISCERVR